MLFNLTSSKYSRVEILKSNFLIIFSTMWQNSVYNERSLKNFLKMFEWLFRPSFWIMSTFFPGLVIFFCFLTSTYFYVFNFLWLFYVIIGFLLFLDFGSSKPSLDSSRHVDSLNLFSECSVSLLTKIMLAEVLTEFMKGS